MNKRAEEMLVMREQGKTFQQISRLMELNVRTVYRIFAELKKKKDIQPISVAYINGAMTKQAKSTQKTFVKSTFKNV